MEPSDASDGHDSADTGDCPACGAESVSFSLPDEYEDVVPGVESTVAFCTRCLTLSPIDDATEQPQFDRVSEAFPADPEAAIPMALLIGLVDNLALYRSEITDLLGDVERAGVDPLLVLDRLEADPAVESDVDLAGRRRHLEQLL